MRLSFLIVFAFAVAALGFARPADAKVHLREVSQIDDALMEVAIADHLRKNCDGISPRMIRAYSRLEGLKQLALGMGYTRQEIKAYVTSKKEKRRMRRKAEAYLTGLGVNIESNNAVCNFGRSEIRKQTGIGSLLR